MDNVILSLLFVGIIYKQVNGQIPISGCPTNWMINNAHCYKFVFDEILSYEEASIACQATGSGLLSINNIQEHTFITQYLNRHAVQSGMGWYTSGQVMSSEIRWFGDGTRSFYDPFDYTYWNQEVRSYFESDKVVYMISETTDRYGWSKQSGLHKRNYICEIPLNEVYRIVQLERDFDFGVAPGTDKFSIPKGPVLINDMIDLVVVESFTPLVIDCVATGTPQPSYTWIVRESTDDPSSKFYEISTATSKRYTFSNGRLTITDPNEAEDAGIYQCIAENSEGAILSPPIVLSFGYLHEFSPNQQGFVEAVQGQGTFLQCNPPSFKPGLVYQWYRETIEGFIRPELAKFYFISSNGNLYLSETQEGNEGDYYCVVTLAPNPGEQLTTSQPPSRTSRAIELRVPGNPNADFGPIIHPDFIAVFPSPPMVGHEVRLECFAYGKMPLQYSWSREGADFPPGTEFRFNNRIMVIPNAQLDAEGNYTCTVLKLTGIRRIDSQKITLYLESKPHFLYPMRNVHADVGSKLTWRCEARAIPRATYRWYKNANILERVPGELDIQGNVLTIHSLDKSKHEGMYQCEAKNAHGIAMTTAQLRVLSIEPTFAKYPLPNSYQSAEGGNLTIPCTPEAAPYPMITWLHNGQAIGDQRRQVMLDGTLQITAVTLSDQGVYTCRAENDNGADESSTRVSILTGIRFLREPLDQNVRINQTAFLYCDVSYNYGDTDLIYSWKFNGHFIDTQNHPHFRKEASGNNHGLYIVNAQYTHTGQYECVAQTVLVSISATAFVEVTGPPDAPAGVYIDRSPDNGNGSVRLVWTWNPAANHGYPVTYFDVEAKTDFSEDWSILRNDIPQHETLVQNMDMKRFYDLTELKPYNSYIFRVRAKNAMGVGLASDPSIKYRVPASEPVTAPSVTNTGGGVEGILVIEWLPLPRSEEAGPGFGYKVYWRLEAETQKGFKEDVVGNVSAHYVTVGQDNFYLRYLVKVQTYNDEGFGPIGPEAVVYSAEGMPVINPQNIRCDAVNSTAVTVSWDPVPNNRESLKGVVHGYEVMYYGDEDPDEDTGGVIVYGQTDHGVVIGLEPNTNYWVYVVVFNGAGPSVLSEIYLCETSLNPPGEYPHFVDVFSDGPQSVRVKWRGVLQVAGEASLVGYKLLYWPVGDDIRTANVTEVDKIFETILYGIQPDIIYNLRVMAVNDGGDGKKSPTVYFTLMKDGSVSVDQSSFDPSTSEILTADASSIQQCFILLVFCLLTCLISCIFSNIL